MTSCCEDAPCDNRGYNVCIENTTADDVLFEFHYADALRATGVSLSTVQSVTVDAGNSICYRINIPPGTILGVMTFVNGELSPLSPIYISCSTHLRAFVAETTGTIMVSSDCSPCPVSCDLACNKKESCLPTKEKPSCKPTCA